MPRMNILNAVEQEAFESAPLIKVGLAENVHFRSRILGLNRFDFTGSYLVRSKDKPFIRTLERNLKTFFAPHQRRPTERMWSGNTETFDSAILPQMLHSIDSFRNIFPDAEFQVHRDISSLIPAPLPRKVPATLSASNKRWRKIMSDLKDYAHFNSLTQRQIAQMLGIKPQQLNDWIQGRREPTAEKMLAILEVLKGKPEPPTKRRRKAKGSKPKDKSQSD